MAKRFIDTGLFDDPWFMDLNTSEKVLWIYCITKCDHAGILEMNEKLCQFQTGLKGMATIIKGLGNRLISVSDHYYFIPKFLEYQYPNFPNSKVRQQESALKILKEFKLFDEDTQRVIKGLTNSYGNVSVSDNGNVSVSDNGNVSVKKEKGKCLMRNSGITQQIVSESFKKTNDLKMANPQYYFNTALAWSDSGDNMRVDWIATVANFARRDLRDSKLQIEKKHTYHKEAAPDNFGILSKVAAPMPQSLKTKFGIK